jgi:endonuclease/exonuclease/phosphatase (EEP) superfamily protein YafD
MNKAWGTLACLALVVLGLAGLGLAWAGRMHVALDVFSQFSLHFMMVAVAGSVGLLLPRWKASSAVATMAALVLAYGAWPHAQSFARVSEAGKVFGEQPIKVASFNAWLPNSQADAVMAEILRLDPDVMVLVEVGPQTEQALAELRSEYPHQYLCTSEPMCHLAIISKFPLHAQSFRVGWRGPPMIRATLGGRADGLTVVGVHTTRFPHSRAQLKQAMALADEMSRISGPLIVMGDMNATPFSRVTRVLSERAALTRLTDLPSWPSTWGLPQIAIDHIFVSTGIRALSGQIMGRPSGSDHYPIAMALGLAAPQHTQAETLGVVRAE